MVMHRFVLGIGIEEPARFLFSDTKGGHSDQISLATLGLVWGERGRKVIITRPNTNRRYQHFGEVIAFQLTSLGTGDLVGLNNSRHI